MVGSILGFDSRRAADAGKIRADGNGMASKNPLLGGGLISCERRKFISLIFALFNLLILDVRLVRSNILLRQEISPPPGRGARRAGWVSGCDANIQLTHPYPSRSGI
jgi:hypothetical protein